jgi:hypothetical protein
MINDTTYWTQLGESIKLNRNAGYDPSTILIFLMETNRACPVCFILRDREFYVLCQFQYDVIHQSEIRDAFRYEGTLCNHHAWFMKALATPVTSGGLFHALITETMGRLDESSAIVRNIVYDRQQPEVIAKLLEGERRCVACEDHAAMETHLIQEMSRLLGDPSFRTTYRTSWGICRPHVASVLARVEDPHLKAFVLQAYLAQLRRQAHELEELERQTAAKVRDLGELAQAHARAVERWAGMRGLALPREEPPPPLRSRLLKSPERGEGNH